MSFLLLSTTSELRFVLRNYEEKILKLCYYLHMGRCRVESLFPRIDGPQQIWLTGFSRLLGIGTPHSKDPTPTISFNISLTRGIPCSFMTALEMENHPRISCYAPLQSISLITSNRPDPIAEVQYPPQVELLAALTKLVKNINSAYTLGVKVNKVIYIGHSFGSFIVLSAVAGSPVGFVDGVILTGFSGLFNWLSLFTSGGQARVAAFSQPSKGGSLPHGYLTPVDLYALTYGGFKSPYFDHDVAKLLFDQQYPFALGELLSAGATVLNLSAIEVPVQVGLRPSSDTKCRDTGYFKVELIIHLI